MTKIVYNACYGGFSLSLEAIKLGRIISGNPQWGGVVHGEKYPDGQLCDSDYNCWGRNIPRTDPVLVEVVEKLGSNASGGLADLRITEIAPGMKYRIDEYDGIESVMTPDDYEWEIA